MEKRAVSPLAIWPFLNSGRTPITVAARSTGTEMCVRLPVPMPSRMRRVSRAVIGRAVSRQLLGLDLDCCLALGVGYRQAERVLRTGSTCSPAIPKR